MANRDLLREAIADAKAVKEVAIANAKAALEEAFTPQLKSMLSEKIAQLDEEDELSEADKVNKEKQMEEAKEMETEGKEKTNEAEELEEELDLEEILAELELEEGDTETMEEEKDPMEEGNHEMEEGYDDSMEEAEDETEGEDDAELDLENMTEEELQSFIEDVIEDMIEDGELVPGPNADESEEEEGEDTDDGMEGDADVDVEVDDIDLQEGKMDKVKQFAQQLGVKVEDALEAFNKLFPEIDSGITTTTKESQIHEEEIEEGMKEKLAKFAEKAGTTVEKVLSAMEFLPQQFNTPSEGKELKEAKTVIKHLQNELNEVNLLNSKLLYTNKIFKAKNLTENQKIKVLKAFDKAETVNEAKVIFESLSENLVDKKAKSNIKESMGFASKPAGVAPKHIITEEKVVEEDAMVSRFKKLAGIK